MVIGSVEEEAEMEFLSSLSTREKRRLLKEIEVTCFVQQLFTACSRLVQESERLSRSMTMREMHDFVAALREGRRTSKKRRRDGEEEESGS